MWDYPRIRGEHKWILLIRIHTKGSPPHTRGTQILILCDISIYRITPAYAGNTGQQRGIQVHIWDHPRIRGEHAISIKFPSSFLGSPTHTRGTLSQFAFPHISPRITPAYAGNTPFAQSLIDSHRDHPRLRGEHSNKIP